MANNDYVYDSQKVNQALGILEGVSAGLRADGTKLKTELDTMLNTWDSSYKAEFISSNNMQLDQQLENLGKSVTAYAAEVSSIASQLCKIEERARQVLG